jgi:putative endonuclease
MRDYYVYIVASRSRTLYTGVTSNLERRVAQHKLKLLPGFTSEYRIERLVYFEHCGDIRAAIQREKQIKGWIREKKLALIKLMNPGWCDLSEGWIRAAPANSASRVARASGTAAGGGERTNADSSLRSE